MKAGFYYGAVLAGILAGLLASPYIFSDYNPLAAPPSNGLMRLLPPSWFIAVVLIVAWFMRPALGGAE